MNLMVKIPAAVMFLTLSSCSSLQVMDMDKIQSDFSKAVQNADGAESRARNDYSEKKALDDKLKKNASAVYRQISPKVNALLEEMNVQLNVLGERRKTMQKANAQLTPLSYSHKKLNSSEPNYAAADTITQDFTKATTDFNAALASYTTASNSLADLVAEKKLYFNFDVADFYTRLQRHLEDSQNILAVMQDGLDHIEAGTPQQGVLQKELEDLATSYSAMAQNYAKINRKMEAVALGASRISSLEARWPNVQKIVGELDNTNHELGLIREKFNRSLADFRAK